MYKVHDEFSLSKHQIMLFIYFENQFFYPGYHLKSLATISQKNVTNLLASFNLKAEQAPNPIKSISLLCNSTNKMNFDTKNN